MLIARQALCALIPHAGDMCLLDTVESWDDTRIVCTSQSHRLTSNPLRENAQLASVHGLEYGAQAMAVHGGLLAGQRGERPRPGYLAALREVKLAVSRLDNIEAPLRIEAVCVVGGADSFMYEFSVSAAQQIVLSARATVIAQVAV